MNLRKTDGFSDEETVYQSKSQTLNVTRARAVARRRWRHMRGRGGSGGGRAPSWRQPGAARNVCVCGWGVGGVINPTTIATNVPPRDTRTPTNPRTAIMTLNHHTIVLAAPPDHMDSRQLTPMRYNTCTTNKNKASCKGKRRKARSSTVSTPPFLTSTPSVRT